MSDRCVLTRIQNTYSLNLTKTAVSIRTSKSWTHSEPSFLKIKGSKLSKISKDAFKFKSLSSVRGGKKNNRIYLSVS